MHRNSKATFRSYNSLLNPLSCFDGCGTSIFWVTLTEVCGTLPHERQNILLNEQQTVYTYMKILL